MAKLRVYPSKAHALRSRRGRQSAVTLCGLALVGRLVKGALTWRTARGDRLATVRMSGRPTSCRTCRMAGATW